MEPDEIIKRELSSGHKPKKELVKAQIKEGIKKPTAYRHINSLQKNGTISEIEGRKGIFTITNRCGKLEETAAEEVDFLLDEAKKKKSPESVKTALHALGTILKRSKVTKESPIWDFYKEALEDNYYKEEWSNLIDNLQVASRNLQEVGDDDCLNTIKKELWPRISALFEPNQDHAILLSITPFIETLYPDEASTIIFNSANNYISNANIDDIKWDHFIDAMLPQLKKYYKENKLKVWKWLFSLLDWDNETIKKRSRKIYQNLQ